MYIDKFNYIYLNINQNFESKLFKTLRQLLN
jgi:hypothetical protein